MQGETNFSRRLKQFGFAWPWPDILRPIYAAGLADLRLDELKEF